MPSEVPLAPERHRRPALTIAMTLSLALALLVGLAVAAVVALTFVSGRNTTLTLIGQKADLLVSALEVRLRETLDPAAGQLSFIAEILSQPEGLADDPARVADVLTGALAAAPQINLVSFNTRAGLAIVAGRGPHGVNLRTIDRSRDRDTMEMVEFASGRAGGFWDLLAFDRDDEAALVTRRHSVWRGNQYLGVLNAYVSVRQVSNFLAQVRAGTSGIGFVLHGREQVLAHPRLTRPLGGLSAVKPLPEVDEVEDPVLSTIWAPPIRALILGGNEIAARAGPSFHVGKVGDVPYVFFHRTIYSFGDTPWIVGTYMPAEEIAGELRTLMLAAGAGGLVLVVAVAAALVIARLLAGPIQRLAAASNRLRRFEFATMADLPPSPIRELDDQARAFNAMLAALRWFESYVPRAHVRRLVRRPDGRAPPSVEREVTVMFTDIVGFTTLSQGMKPADTAAMLNRHFALLTEAIESEGGTVDKFIGDSVMAF